MSLFRATTNITRSGSRRLILGRTEGGDKDDDTLELGEGRGEKITTQYSFFAWRHRGGTAAGRRRWPMGLRLVRGGSSRVSPVSVRAR